MDGIIPDGISQEVKTPVDEENENQTAGDGAKENVRKNIHKRKSEADIGLTGGKKIPGQGSKTTKVLKSVN